MATIVRPYNDWREQAAVNILSPIITGLLNRHFESEDNRKRNALMGQVISDLHATQEQPVSMTAPAMPEGYNANGWASAYHQNENPVARYDIATTGLVPIQSLQRNPNIQEIQDALIRNMATRRFGGVSPQVAQADMTPYIQAAEQDRRERMRNDVAASYANATDAAGRRDALARGAIQGITPWEAVTQGQRQYEYDNPSLQPYSFNTGSTTEYGGFNPRTGEYTRQGEYFNGLTPSQFAENDYRMKQAAQQSEQFWATFREGQRQFGVNTELQRDQQNMMRDEMNRPKYGQPFAGSDGKMYQLDQYGNSRPFMVGSEHMDAPREPIKSEWTKGDDAYVENIRAEIKALEEKLQNKKDSKPNFPKTEDGMSEQDKYDNEIAELQAGIQQKRGQLSSYITGKTGYGVSVNKSSGGSLGSLMIGNANAGRVSRHGEFGNDRKTHAHKGTDYPAQAGTPITVRPEMGDSLKVVHVNADPNASTYGNNVLLEGRVGGHKVQYRMAHMQTGSIKVKVGDTVKPGDVIGGVGSTGRSSGNHLHLEVIVDGQHVDPEMFLSAYGTSSKVNVTSQSAQDNNMPTVSQVAPQLQTRRIAPSPVAADTYNLYMGLPNVQASTPALANSPQSIEAASQKVLYTNPDGMTVTEKDFSELVQSRIARGMTEEQAREAVKSELRDKGFMANIVPNISSIASKSMDFASNIRSLRATNPEEINHATNKDIQAGVDRLNGDDVPSYSVWRARRYAQKNSR